jgi:hypothetical protein
MGPLFLIEYGLETEWLLSWFPTRAARPEYAELQHPAMRGGVFLHSTGEFHSLSGGGEYFNHLLAQGEATGVAEDPLEHDAKVVAFIEIGLSRQGQFEAKLTAQIGTVKQQRSVSLPPDTRTPVMIYVAADGQDEQLRDTAAMLQVVFATTTPFRLGEILSTAVGRVGKP